MYILRRVAKFVRYQYIGQIRPQKVKKCYDNGSISIWTEVGHVAFSCTISGQA